MAPYDEQSKRTPQHSALPAFAAMTIALLLQAGSAFAASAPSVPPGFTITKIASPSPASASNCDDLAFLEGHLFLGCQNRTLSVGGGGTSTLIEYTQAGAVLNTWPIADKIDGMAGDPLNHRLIITLNEDTRSHLMTLTPSAPAAQQLTHTPTAPTRAAHPLRPRCTRAAVPTR